VSHAPTRDPADGGCRWFALVNSVVLAEDDAVRPRRDVPSGAMGIAQGRGASEAAAASTLWLAQRVSTNAAVSASTFVLEDDLRARTPRTGGDLIRRPRRHVWPAVARGVGMVSCDGS